MEFQGKKAFITGASVGIGRAVALLLAERGAKIVAIDMNEITLAKLEAEIKEKGGEILAYKCDVSDENAVYEVVRDAEEKLGGMDILVNNAALWRSHQSFEDVPTDEWRRYFDVNVFGTVYCTRAILPGMKERGYGRIINVSSIAGVYGNAGMSHYSATKGAINAMTKALAKEVTPLGVLVNSVSPGSVSPSDNEDIDFHRPSDLSFTGRTGTDRENAELICFLASDKASYISGQNYQIDGCRKKM